jgi:transposase
MCEKIVPYLNPWPLPRSILVLDNAKIHMYKELEAIMHSRGAMIFFLPPYSPQLNPIEVAFAQLKQWILKYPLAFRFDIRATLEVALVRCIDEASDVGLNLYSHCGYEVGTLDVSKFAL